MSRRTSHIFMGISSWLVARFSWRPKSSSSSSRRRVASSPSDRSRAWLACTVRSSSLADLGGDRELVGSEPQGLAPDLRENTLHLEQHASRLDDGDPCFGIALALTHA